MDHVQRQYETYPYPARDPADEAVRLIEGSPSDPVEIDHYLFRGSRDWSVPFRALVAGGGTGDGLIMLAQRLADIGCPAEITYLDLSTASRGIAEARAEARGLPNIRWVTGDLLTAPELGPFDYIDCCGVLHHLPDPDQGFRALAEALAPGGGLGAMVYAPLGRSGVYPLQEAFGRLLAGDAPARQVALANAALEGLAPTHPFRHNPLVGDHKTGDAGLYDLLLHSRDRPYRVDELSGALQRAGLELVSFVERGRYDPLRYLPGDAAFAERIDPMDPIERAVIAELLSGNMKTHIIYAAGKPRGGEDGPEAGSVVDGGSADRMAGEAAAAPDAVPHLKGVAADALARQIAARGQFSLTSEGLSFTVTLPRAAAPAIAGIDGRRTLGEIAGGNWLGFLQHWGPVQKGLTGFNLLHFSKGARR